MSHEIPIFTAQKKSEDRLQSMKWRRKHLGYIHALYQRFELTTLEENISLAREIQSLKLSLATLVNDKKEIVREKIREKRRELTLRNWGLVRMVVKSFDSRLDQDSVFQHGMLALWRSTNHYDPDHAVSETGELIQFSTYAVTAIIRETQRHSKDCSIEHFRYVLDKGKRDIRTAKKVLESWGTGINNEDIYLLTWYIQNHGQHDLNYATFLDYKQSLKKTTVKLRLQLYGNIDNLHFPISLDSDVVSEFNIQDKSKYHRNPLVTEYISDGKIFLEDQMINRDLIRFTEDVLTGKIYVGLKPRDRIIMSRYFGFSSESRMTLEQIGQDYSLTRERIRQIVKRGGMIIKEAYNFPERRKKRRDVVKRRYDSIS